MVLVRRVFIATLVLLALVLSILMAVLVFVGRGIPSALEPDGDANTSYVIRGAGVLSMD